MPPEIAEALAIMTTMLGVGSFILIGMRMRIGARERMARIKAEGHGDDYREVIDSLQAQVDSLSDELTELNERIDFAERLLTQGRQPAAEEHPVVTPV